MKMLLACLLLVSSFYSFAGDTFKVHAIEDHQGKACNIAMGIYRREVKSRCDKLKKKVDWEQFETTECIKKKLSKKKFKATYKATYTCM